MQALSEKTSHQGQEGSFICGIVEKRKVFSLFVEGSRKN